MFYFYCSILKIEVLLFSGKSPLPVEIVLHPVRLESGTTNLPFPFVLHPSKLHSPTDTYSLYHNLLIYLRVWKPVADNFDEITGFEQEMSAITTRT